MAKTLLAGALAAVALTLVGARAADFNPYTPAPSATVWQGPYVGGNLGYQWGSVSNDPVKPRGIAGGIQAGYNLQQSRFVFGGETDLQLTDSDATFANWTATVAWRWAGLDRVAAEVQHVTNPLGRTTSGLPTTLGGDTVALRGQIVW